MEDKYNETQNPNDYCDYCHIKLAAAADCHYCLTSMCLQCSKKTRCPTCGIFFCFDCLLNWEIHEESHNQ